jgi:putative CocE/NonD family hydrolase
MPKLLWHLPLADMQRSAGRNAQFYRDWVAHPDYDEYWEAINAEEAFRELDIPVLNFGGWFDLFRQGTLRGYTGLRTNGKSVARTRTHLVMGPWGHWPSRKVGSLDFGEAAFVDQNALALRWFDYWLKNLDNGIGREPPVKLFVMGRNRWRAEAEYPLVGTNYRPLYLRGSGHANTRRGDGRLSWQKPSSNEPPDRFTYDPENPVRDGGPGREAGPSEMRADVLVYTSDPLREELEVTGPVHLKIFAASDARDTDFVGRLMDVYPDGRSICVAEGILRARYRNSVSHPEFLEPDKVYALDIDLVGTSNAFMPGHRIRVDVTSSHFPAFDRHPNTDAPFGSSARLKVARQTLYHNQMFPSHILLPVVPSKPLAAVRGIKGTLSSLHSGHGAQLLTIKMTDSSSPCIMQDCQENTKTSLISRAK